VIDRYIHYRFQRVYHSHLASRAEDDYQLAIRGADAIEFKDFIEFLEPFELRELKVVVERSNAPFTEDEAVSYMPGERRTRRLSPKERRDSWMGSELTMDDFFGFSGQVTDYRWALLGTHRVLGIVDSRHRYAHFYGPYSRVPRDRFELRPVWVVEGFPRDPEHPYSSRILFIDRESSVILMALMFDREQQLWKSMLTIYAWSEASDNEVHHDAGKYVFRYTGASIVDCLSGKATVNIQPRVEYPEIRSREARQLFSDSNLTQGR
jgi:hypothetical protein